MALRLKSSLGVKINTPNTRGRCTLHHVHMILYGVISGASACEQKETLTSVLSVGASTSVLLYAVNLKQLVMYGLRTK